MTFRPFQVNVKTTKVKLNVCYSVFSKDSTVQRDTGSTEFTWNKFQLT